DVAHLYSTRHVLAALTDRPTYRPGQEVQFKLIVRRLAGEPNAARAEQTFRAEDFDLASRLVVPESGTSVHYAVLDARGRTVSDGNWRLNAHGTAAGTAELNAEAALGAYALRVNVGGTEYLLPEVFAVRAYRRPNFELRIADVPEKM